MKVWIKLHGDPGDPSMWAVHDVATGNMVTNLKSIETIVNGGMRTLVRLTYANGHTEQCDLVSEPKPTVGQDLVSVGLRRGYNPAQTCTEFDLEARIYNMDAHGVAQPSGNARGIGVRIADQDIALVYDPDRMVRDKIVELGRELGATLVRDLLNQNGKPMGLPLHARAMLGGLTIVKPPAPKQPTPQTKAPFFVPAGNGHHVVLPAAKCGECGGTGQWENPVSGKRSPCSRGCKP